MSDLYVIEGIDDYDADGRHWSRPVPRKATFAEKVAALQEETGETVTTVTGAIFCEPGTYLVVRIDGETP